MRHVAPITEHDTLMQTILRDAEHLHHAGLLHQAAALSTESVPRLKVAQSILASLLSGMAADLDKVKI